MLKFNNTILLKLFLIILIITIFNLNSLAIDDTEISGLWKGKIILEGKELNISVKFFKSNDKLKATIDIPLQKVYDYNLKKVEYKDGKVYFELPAKEIGKFSGTLKKSEIRGKYVQGVREGKFYIKKDTKKETVEDENNGNNKVNEKENEKGNNDLLDTKGDNQINNKHTDRLFNNPPENRSSYPVAVIISDFGVISEKNDQLHRKVAQIFKNRGYVVYRYENSEFDFTNTATDSKLIFENIINEVSNYINNMLKEPAHSEVCVIGHNQGALLSMLALQNIKVNKFISINGPLKPASEIILEQLSNLRNDLLAETRYIINKLKKGEKVKEISSELKPFFAREIQPFLITWFKYNPEKIIPELNEDILVITDNKNNKIKKIYEKNKKLNYLEVNKLYKIKKEETSSMNREIYLNNLVEEKIIKFIKDKN